MKTELGEYIVGAYLSQRLGCDFVGYNIRPPEAGLAGLAELDVVGLRHKDKTAFLCEVTTHLEGLQYGSYATTISKVNEKHQRQKRYAELHLKDFTTVHFMFWSPVVREGAITKALSTIDGLELVINSAYTRCIRELEEIASGATRDLGNPAMRFLQILTHLRKDLKQENKAISKLGLR
ncbi:MAG: hypothetical protein PHS14_00895 [Elusimicrobia bacterium]|nr:hypothetical protein [Elusimicrobiota bacterium]